MTTVRRLESDLGEERAARAKGEEDMALLRHEMRARQRAGAWCV